MSLIPYMNDVAAEAAAIPKIRPRGNGGSRTASDFEVNLQVDASLWYIRLITRSSKLVPT